MLMAAPLINSAFPTITLDPISTDWLLGPSNNLLTHYTGNKTPDEPVNDHLVHSCTSLSTLSSSIVKRFNHGSLSWEWAPGLSRPTTDF